MCRCCFFTSCFPALLDLKTVCNELGSVKVKSHEIGVLLGIPQHKLLEFQKGDNPLPAIADFWLRGNVEGAEVSWKSIATALASDFVGEPALAKKISQIYCQVEESQKGIASPSPASVNHDRLFEWANQIDQIAGELPGYFTYL